MRAIRFAAQLNFKIEGKTFNAIAKTRERISIISKERICEELNKILLSPTPSIGFTLLNNSGLLQLVFPEIAIMKGIETISGKGHKDIFYHTLEVVDNISAKSDNLWLRWAALLHDVGKPSTKKFEQYVTQL